MRISSVHYVTFKGDIYIVWPSRQISTLCGLQGRYPHYVTFKGDIFIFRSIHMIQIQVDTDKVSWLFDLLDVVNFWFRINLYSMLRKPVTFSSVFKMFRHFWSSLQDCARVLLFLKKKKIPCAIWTWTFCCVTRCSVTDLLRSPE